jgi:hypothetical protein
MKRAERMQLSPVTGWNRRPGTALERVQKNRRRDSSQRR